MVVLATKLLETIDQAIASDKGAQFRINLKTLLPKMEDAYRGAEDKYRSHLGASQIGRSCPRELAYNFRWAGESTFPPRILRLFNRGHLEEARFLAMLQLVPGLDLWYETSEGGQFRLSDFGGHFGSALDGIVRNIPDLPMGVPAYSEFKTMGNSQFNKLTKSGMEASKPEHYAQCQMCMHYMKLPYTLYMVVNKDNDQLYAEIIPYNEAVANNYRTRAESIIFMSQLPQRISSTPTWYECKNCTHVKVCYNERQPDPNCRTCQHSKPNESGGWTCKKGDPAIGDKKTAMEGCGLYRLSHLFTG
ncbi:exonuclease [Vibrio phage 2.117.O._10N.261.45.E9]|nr:exonuclease [Vibrio phage 1.117.O._10N.261.45.E9]AUR95467.1 exonuclease [Vibrio phage 1.207.B._10N.222.51.C2]AUS02358.1 exonuclease [Vibrio phage 2.117.O._10N.261.45.E9]